MDKMADVLGRAGAWCGQNKYLSAIKNAFQNFMPLTIAGAIGVLWCNVLVNETTGLGMFFKPIMALDFLNPAFQAVNFCTISCITVGITLGIAQEIGIWNMGAEKAGYIPGLVGLAAWLSVTNTSHMVEGAKDAFTGIAGNELGATGLFTGMIIGVLSVELFCFFEKQDALKIKMPEQVPPAVARTFKLLLPIVIITVSFSILNFFIKKFAPGGLHELVYTVIQTPLTQLGQNVGSVLILTLISQSLWVMGIHGPNTIAAVRDTMFAEATNANLSYAAANGTAWGAPYPVTFNGLYDAFGAYGGSGATLGLIIAIFIFSKAKEQKSIAKLSFAPGLFNINEMVIFGLPIVLNPIYIIPFILTPLVNITIGYLATSVMRIIPPVAYGVPWTTPGPLAPFLGTGGNIMGLVIGLICLAVSVFTYAPFVIAASKAELKNEEEATLNEFNNVEGINTIQYIN